MSEPASSLADLNCLILAGGLGTRLRSVIGQRQKVLAEVNDRPFLAYLLDQLNKANASKVILCTGYGAEHISKLLGSRYKGLEIYYSPEETPLGTGGALRLALPLISSPEVIVMNGDSFCNVDLVEFRRWHTDKKNFASMVVTQATDCTRFGRVEASKDSARITQFVEKASAAGPGWVNAGIYLLQTTLIEAIHAGRAVSLEQEMFPYWLDQGMFAYHTTGPFIDIGTPESYAEASQFFKTW